jgi:hypothetical protein
LPGLTHSNADAHLAYYAKHFCIEASLGQDPKDVVANPKQVFTIAADEKERDRIDASAQKMFTYMFHAPFAGYKAGNTRLASELEGRPDVTWVDGLTYMVNTATPRTGHP